MLLGLSAFFGQTQLSITIHCARRFDVYVLHLKSIQDASSMMFSPQFPAFQPTCLHRFGVYCLLSLLCLFSCQTVKQVHSKKITHPCCTYQQSGERPTNAGHVTSHDLFNWQKLQSGANVGEVGALDDNNKKTKNGILWYINLDPEHSHCLVETNLPTPISQGLC